MIVAGGTGGHVFPALAVAELLRAHDAAVVWIGTQAGLEARLVPQAGFPIEWLQLRALKSRNCLGLLGAAPGVLRAVAHSLRLLRRYRPSVVLGMGGYASSAMALAAWLSRVPLVVHEQNAVAGLTNRILSKFATRTLLGFVRVRGLRGGICTGNPVRAGLGMPPPTVRASSGPLRLLVIGGSQGAEAFNTVLPAALHALPVLQRPQVWHQTGTDPASVAARYPAQAEVRTDAFITAMDEAYAWADLVLARAGAMTLAELAAVARPALLVPYPHAADGHQLENARQYAVEGAAEIWPQPTFTRERLAQRLAALAQDRTGLDAMAAAAGRQARPHAAQDIADCLLEFCP